MTQLPLQFDSPQFTLPPARGVARQIALAGGLLHYGFVRAQRRTLSIVLGRQGVEVRAPRWIPLAQVENFIREKESWIRRRMGDVRTDAGAFSWRDGESLPLFGQTVSLQVLPTAATPRARKVLQTGDRVVAHLHGSDSSEHLRAAVLNWLRETSLALFRERIAHYAQSLGVPVPVVRISNARTRWGSCHSSGRVSLNWRLVHMPPRLIDYVVAHEIAHLLEMNHSPRFWSLVEQLYPGCRAARRELNLLEKRIPRL